MYQTTMNMEQVLLKAPDQDKVRRQAARSSDRSWGSTEDGKDVGIYLPTRIDVLYSEASSGAMATEDANSATRAAR